MASTPPPQFRVVCPKCSIQYPVDARALSGVQVKCKRCSHVFTAMPLPAGSNPSDYVTRTLPSFHPDQHAKPAAAPPAAKAVSQPVPSHGPRGEAAPGSGPVKS